MKAILLSLAAGLLLLLLIESCRRLWQKYKFWRWSNHLKLKQHFAIFQELYQSVNGYLLSKHDRQRQDEPALVYGEIEFFPFVALLSLSHLQKDSVFIDLGSGSGKAVLSCAMVFQPRKAIGIEKLESLFHISEQQKKKLEALENYNDCAQHIEFWHQDFLTAPLDEASHIFINATAFFGELWLEIQDKLNNLAHLQWIITTSKPLELENFKCIHTTEVIMSWGVVTAYIHQRHDQSVLLQD